MIEVERTTATAQALAIEDKPVLLSAAAIYRILAAFLLSGTATAAVWRLLRSPRAGVDDGNIFLVYGRNFADGFGFVFNTGGERVEGFTSLLWVLVCALAMWISRYPELLLLAFSTALLTSTAILCVRSPMIASGRNSPFWTTAFLLLLLSDVRFIAWNTITLMDAPLWTFGLTLSAVMAVSPAKESPAKAGAYVLLLLLTRPEAVLWVPVVLLVAHANGLKRLAPVALAYVTTISALTAFRLAYFGYPLPNTFYAKVSPSFAFTVGEGLRYCSDYLLSAPVPFLCAAALLASICHIARVGFRDMRTVGLTALGLTGLLMPVAGGGDHFGGFRFYQSVYPVLLLVLINCVRVVAPQYIRWSTSPAIERAARLGGVTTALAIFLVVNVLAWTDIHQRTRLPHEFQIAESGRKIGSAATAVFRDLATRPQIGTITVGGLQYTYDGAVVDLMGLNNTRMAHNGGSRVGYRAHAAFEKATFYELKPTILVPLVQVENNLASLQQHDPFAEAALKGLLRDREFHELYDLAEVRRTLPGGTVTFAGWFRKTFLAELQRSGQLEVTTAPPETAEHP